MIIEVSRIHATIQASRNGRPRMSGVARLTKNGPTIRARNGTTASQRMLRMNEHFVRWRNLPPCCANNRRQLRKFRWGAPTLVAAEQRQACAPASSEMARPLLRRAHELVGATLERIINRQRLGVGEWQVLHHDYAGDAIDRKS